MTQPTSYQELEERLEVLENALCVNKRKLEISVRSKRYELLAQKNNKLSSLDAEATVQMEKFAAEELSKTNSVKARQVKELDDLLERHNRELSVRAHAQRVLTAELAGKHSTERTKLEKKFEEDESAIDSFLQGKMDALERTFNLDEEQIKNDLYEFVKSRRRQKSSTQDMEPLPAALPNFDKKACLNDMKIEPGLKDALQTEVRESTAAESPVLLAALLPLPEQKSNDQLSNGNPQNGEDHEMPHKANNQASRQKRGPVDNAYRDSAHTAASEETEPDTCLPKRRKPLPLSRPLDLKRYKPLTSSFDLDSERYKPLPPSTILDPKQYFEVLRLRYTKHSSGGNDDIGKWSLRSDLRKEESETLYLEMVARTIRPVSMQEGKQLPEAAAKWYVKSKDTLNLQSDELSCATCLWFKGGIIWIKFKDQEVAKTFLSVIEEDWPKIKANSFKESYRHLEIPADFED